MRKDVACILAGVALLFALVLYFQQQPVKKAEPMRVGVVYLAPYRVFTYQVVQDIKELSEQNPDISVSFLDGDNKVEQQRALIHQLVQERVQAIILFAADSEEILPALWEAQNAGIPVVAVNVRVFGSSSSYVGVMDYDVGWLQGEYMRHKLPYGANLLYLAGPKGNYTSEQRLQGFVDACLMYRQDLHIINGGAANYKRNLARDIVRDKLAAIEHLDAVVAADDEMAIGAYEALAEAGRADGVMISGVNGSQEACRLIAAGKMTQTVLQDHQKEAQAAYDTLLQILSGNKPGDVLLPLESITRDNVEYYLP